MYYERSSSFQIKLLFGKVLKELNRKAEAQKILHELDIQYPNNLNVLIELATFHYRQGNVDESIDFFNKILFLDPYNNIAKERLQKIQDIKKNKVAERLEDTLTEFWDISQHNIEKHTVEPIAAVDHFPTSIEAEDILVKDDFNNIAVPEQLHEIDNLEKIDDNRFEELAKDDFSSLFDSNKEHVMDEGEKSDSHKEHLVDDFEKFDVKNERIVVEAEKNDITQIKSLEEEPEDIQENEPVVERSLTETADIEFETESAADLYFKQGLLKEAQKIYKKLYLQTSDEKYFAKLNEIANIQSRTKELEIIKRLTNLMNCIQEKGRNHFV